MQSVKYKWTLLAVVALMGFVTTIQAQKPYRETHEQVKGIIQRIEKGAEAFRGSLLDALLQTRLDHTQREDTITHFIKDFEEATNRLKDRFHDDNTAEAAVEEVLWRGVIIEDFMSHHGLTQRAQRDWREVHQNLNALARAYHIGWNWASSSRAPYRVSQENMKALMEGIEKQADRFRSSLDEALDKSKFDGGKWKDAINGYVRDFEVTTDQLKDRFNDNYAATGTVGEVLRRAAWINQFMQRNSLTTRAQNDWTALRGSLEELARAYNVALNWRDATIILR